MNWNRPVIRPKNALLEKILRPVTTIQLISTIAITLLAVGSTAILDNLSPNYLGLLFGGYIVGTFLFTYFVSAVDNWILTYWQNSSDGEARLKEVERDPDTSLSLSWPGRVVVALVFLAAVLSQVGRAGPGAAAAGVLGSLVGTFVIDAGVKRWRRKRAAS